jgi:hypothetical protein
VDKLSLLFGCVKSRTSWIFSGITNVSTLHKQVQYILAIKRLNHKICDPTVNHRPVGLIHVEVLNDIVLLMLIFSLCMKSLSSSTTGHDLIELMFSAHLFICWWWRTFLRVAGISGFHWWNRARIGWTTSHTFFEQDGHTYVKVLLFSGCLLVSRRFQLTSDWTDYVNWSRYFDW